MTPHRIKTLLKNDYIFNRKIWNTKKDFIVYFNKLLNDWSSPYRDKTLGQFCKQKNYKTAFKKQTIATDQRLKFIKSLKEKGEFEKFSDDIYDFIKKYDFGFEWSIPIMDIVISDWFCSPFYNLNISSSGSKNKKRITLTLNPDTSLDDIKDAWAEIKKKQHKGWPNFKKTNITKKSFPNLNTAIKDLEERLLKGAKEFDEITLQSYKQKDSDIAGKIWSEEDDISISADKKRTVNLRQIRKRLKRS